MERFDLNRGINLGGWMSQCDYSKERLDGFIKASDIERIASWGMDHIRLPLDYNVIQNEDGSMKEDGLCRVDSAVGLAKKNGLRIVLDLHKTRGYSFDKGENEAGFFSDEALQGSFYGIWRTLAGRYGSDPDNIVFELLNEVNEESDIDAWNRISNECIRQIRKDAPETFILVGSYHGNSVKAVKDLSSPFDDHVIYNFHCYEPIRFTHQGAYWIDDEFPSLRMPFAESGVNEDFFARMFEPAIEKASREGTCLYCGEYGVIDVVSPEDTLAWYKAIHKAFRKYGIGRAAWSYKEMDFGLSDPRMDGIRDELLEVLRE